MAIPGMPAQNAPASPPEAPPEAPVNGNDGGINFAEMFRNFGKPPEAESPAENAPAMPQNLQEAFGFHDQDALKRMLSSVNPLQGVQVPEQYQDLSPVLQTMGQSMMLQMFAQMTQKMDPFLQNQFNSLKPDPQSLQAMVDQTMNMRQIQQDNKGTLEKFQSSGLDQIIMNGIKQQYPNASPEMVTKALQEFADQFIPKAAPESDPKAIPTNSVHRSMFETK